MNIQHQLNYNDFYKLLDDEKKEAETTGEDMLCAIIYLKKSDKARLSDINKHVANDYDLNKI